MNRWNEGAMVLALAASIAVWGCGVRGTAETAGGEGHAGHEGEEHGHEEEGHEEAGHEEAGHDEHGHDEASVTLTPEAIRNARIRVAPAGPARITVSIEAPGEVHLDAERVLEIRPRYAGVVRELDKRVGDRVAKGERVAVIESNESLSGYDVVSPLAGTTIARNVVAGQSVDAGASLMTIADLSSVWVEFAIYPQHAGRIRSGMPVRVTAQNRPELTANGTIRYVGPLLEQDTRVSSARVVLANGDGRWQPGLFVNASVAVDDVRVAVAVPEEAIVRTAEGPAVFHARAGKFVMEQVTLGRSDGRMTEVTAGVAAGDTVVVAQAFILKAELGKGEVAHEH